MRGITVALALCLAAACGTDPAVAPPSEPATPGGGPAFATTSCAQPARTSAGISRRLNCGQVVPVVSTNSTISQKIPAAINVWNSGVLGQQGLPSFTASNVAAPLKVNIVFGASDGTTWHCGTTDFSGLMTIYRSGVKADCGLVGQGIRFTGVARRDRRGVALRAGRHRFDPGPLHWVSPASLATSAVGPFPFRERRL